MVEPDIPIEVAVGFRMVIGRCYIRFALVQYKACQGEAATNLENAKICDIECLHDPRQRFA